MEWWSNGALQNKHQVSGFQVSGVRCQERKTKKLKPPQKLAIFTYSAV
jgi:hypothetical protein